MNNFPSWNNVSSDDYDGDDQQSQVPKKHIISLGLNKYLPDPVSQSAFGSERNAKYEKYRTYREALENDRVNASSRNSINATRKPYVRKSNEDDSYQTTLLIGNGLDKNDITDLKKQSQLSYHDQLKADIESKKIQSSIPKVHVLKRVNQTINHNQEEQYHQQVDFQIGGNEIDRNEATRSIAMQIQKMNKAEILAKIQRVPMHDYYEQLSKIECHSATDNELKYPVDTREFNIGLDEKEIQSRKREMQKKYHSDLTRDSSNSNSKSSEMNKSVARDQSHKVYVESTGFTGLNVKSMENSRSLQCFDEKANRQQKYRDMLLEQQAISAKIQEESKYDRQVYDGSSLPYMRY